MPEPRQHTEHRNALESLLRHIPGFRGYLEKEYRRDSDALQRTWLSDRLQQAKRSLDTVSSQLADAGRLDLLTQYDRLRAKLDKLIARIRGAWQGYSGIFDLVRIDESAAGPRLRARRVDDAARRGVFRVDQAAGGFAGQRPEPIDSGPSAGHGIRHSHSRRRIEPGRRILTDRGRPPRSRRIFTPLK